MSRVSRFSEPAAAVYFKEVKVEITIRLPNGNIKEEVGSPTSVWERAPF